jgi:membrane-associated PAP2 superfamily phosphatase
MPNRQFLLRHLTWPTVITIFLFGGIRLLQIDELLAGLFYQNGQWVYKNHWWLSHVMHDLGRTLMLSIFLLLLAFRLSWSWQKKWLPLPLNDLRGITYLLVCLVFCVLAVNVGKFFLHFPCPWTAQWEGVFKPYQWQAHTHGCFPSGHASSGYAWFGLYYLALLNAPQYRTLGLGLALVLGLTFGMGQLVRGAHFLSHDLACAYLCWLIATGLYLFVVRTQPPTPT